MKAVTQTHRSDDHHLVKGSISFSSQLWLNKNRNWLAMAGAGVAGVVIGTLLKRKLRGGEIQNEQHQFLL